MTPRQFWRRVLELLFSGSPGNTGRTSQPDASGPRQGTAQAPQPANFSVEDRGGHQVATASSLQDAHRQWQELTDQTGHIINLRTGQDVTPERDDNGRYVVTDEDGRQVGSFDDKDAAIDSWERETNSRGRIIDMDRKRDVTPTPDQYMDATQMAALIDLVQGRTGHSRGDPEADLGIDPALVAEMIQQINALELPVFHISNIAGQDSQVPTKTVPIKRRKVTIVRKRKIVTVDGTGQPVPTGRISVPLPTDEVDIRRITSVRELRRVPVSQLLPYDMLDWRVATHRLMRPVYQQTTYGPAPVRKRRVWMWVEEPEVSEWTENVQVTEEPRAQLLEIIRDVSGSMVGDESNLAVAVACAIIGRHRQDGSRYIHRAFADRVGRKRQAHTPGEKAGLIKDLIGTKSYHGLGGGTNILLAIKTSADDVRAVAGTQDRPEILFVSDGDDNGDELTARAVYDAVGQDVTLHTVLVNGSNADLKARSSTYIELWWVGGRVVLSTDGPPMDQGW